MDLNAYFKEQLPLAPSQDYPQVPRIVCGDGFSLSVQVSRFHYCEPRINHANRYSSVEVGFPSATPELITEYAEKPSFPTETVYPFTPIELVEQLIDLHGGVAKAKGQGGE